MVDEAASCETAARHAREGVKDVAISGLVSSVAKGAENAKVSNVHAAA
mgnify:CR=1 FL=1